MSDSVHASASVTHASTPVFVPGSVPPPVAPAVPPEPMEHVDLPLFDKAPPIPSSYVKPLLITCAVGIVMWMIAHVVFPAPPRPQPPAPTALLDDTRTTSRATDYSSFGPLDSGAPIGTAILPSVD